MEYCKKCGAYIPIGETTCPACGYDPEEEARQARERQEREAEEARRRKEAEEAAEKERREKERRAKQQQSWAEQERKREEERRQRWGRDPRQGQSYSSGAAQSQYTSQRTGQSGTQSQYTSQRTDKQTGWTPPWKETRNRTSSSSASYEENRARAADSAANQDQSTLSYLGPLFLIPLFTRPNDDFARFHAGQGLNLFLLEALSVSIFAGPLRAAGILFSIYCAIKGISSVRKGKKEPLPLIGKLKLFR